MNWLSDVKNYVISKEAQKDHFGAGNDHQRYGEKLVYTIPVFIIVLIIFIICSKYLYALNEWNIIRTVRGRQ